MDHVKPQSNDVRFALREPDVAKDPGPYLAMLRSCPVAHSESHGGFWILSKYEDVQSAARNHEVYSSAGGVNIPVQPARLPCLEQDQPEHSLYRRPMQSWFSPGRMRRLEPMIRELVTSRIDGFVDEGAVDLGPALADPVPPIVMALLFGLPEADWGWFRERTYAYMTLGAEGDVEGAQKALGEVQVYLDDKLNERRHSPKADMLTDITQMTVHGELLSHEQAGAVAFLLLAAGHETTVGGIGGMLYRVAGDTAVRDRLRDNPALIPSAVEESLRLETPIPGLARSLQEDADLRDASMSKGERVMLLFAAANRDGDVFENPEEFVPDRPRNQHLAFGSGIHRCVGAPLARLEMRVVLEEVLRRLPQVQLQQDPVVECAQTRVYRSLPVVW